MILCFEICKRLNIVLLFVYTLPQDIAFNSYTDINWTPTPAKYHIVDFVYCIAQNNALWYVRYPPTWGFILLLFRGALVSSLFRNLQTFVPIRVFLYHNLLIWVISRYCVFILLLFRGALGVRSWRANDRYGRSLPE